MDYSSGFNCWGYSLLLGSKKGGKPPLGFNVF